MATEHPILTTCLQIVSDHPQHYLPAAYRLEVYRLFKPDVEIADHPSAAFGKKHAPPTAEHIHYGEFAIATVRLVLPRWDAEPIDPVYKSYPYEVLETAEHYLRGEISMQEASVLATREHWDSLPGVASRTSKPHYAIAKAAIHALNMILGSQPIHELHGDTSLFDGYEDDPSIGAAIGYCVDDPNPPGDWHYKSESALPYFVDNQRQLEFWEMWLRTADEMVRS